MTLDYRNTWHKISVEHARAIATAEGHPVEVAEQFGVHRTTVVRLRIKHKIGRPLGRRKPFQAGKVWVPVVEPEVRAWLSRSAP